MGNREQNSAFSFLPRTSSRGCIFSLLPHTVRRAVNGDTWMAILAAHTAENELRTFSIVFLKGKSSKNHERLHCLAGGMEFCTRGFRADPMHSAVAARVLNTKATQNQRGRARFLRKFRGFRPSFCARNAQQAHVRAANMSNVL